MVINAFRRVLRCIVISAREGHRASRCHAATEAFSKSAIRSSSISNDGCCWIEGRIMDGYPAGPHPDTVIVWWVRMPT